MLDVDGSVPTRGRAIADCANEKEANLNGDFDLVKQLKLLGLEVIDKRPVGGALWVVGDRSLEQTLVGLRERGYRFVFAKDGGKASKHRPAWYKK